MNFARRLLSLAALAAAALFISACSRSSEPGPQMDVSFHILGEAAPRSLSNFLGRPVVFTLWEPGCSACDQQAATLDALAKRFSSDGLVCLALYSRSHQFSVIGLSMLHGTIDPSQAASLPSARPVTILLDRQGRTRGQFDSFRDAEALAAEIDTILGR
jgi:thiol-disulfide isomerase/thioredoxin